MAGYGYGYGYLATLVPSQVLREPKCGFTMMPVQVHGKCPGNLEDININIDINIDIHLYPIFNRFPFVN